MRQTFSKILITSMIFSIFAIFSLQPISSLAAAADSSLITTEESTLIKQDEISTQDLPPRQPTKDPVWKWVTLVVAGFVGIQLAEIFVSNAINNGIDWACDKYDHITGIKQACKIIN